MLCAWLVITTRLNIGQDGSIGYDTFLWTYLHKRLICTKTNKLLIKSMKGISTLKRLMQQIETIWVNNIDPYTRSS